jgi:hypothetical protein
VRCRWITSLVGARTNQAGRPRGRHPGVKTERCRKEQIAAIVLQNLKVWLSTRTWPRAGATARYLDYQRGRGRNRRDDGHLATTL